MFAHKAQAIEADVTGGSQHTKTTRPKQRSIDDDATNQRIKNKTSTTLDESAGSLIRPNRITNRCDQLNFLVMRQAPVVWQPIDDPQHDVRRQFERRQRATDADDLRLSESHQSNANLVSNRLHRFSLQQLSFRFLCKKQEDTLKSRPVSRDDELSSKQEHVTVFVACSASS